MAAPPRASFLGLPLEVRWIIYEYILSAPQNLNAFQIENLVRSPIGKCLNGELFNINITRSCRQCRREATPIFWDVNILDMDSVTMPAVFDSVSHFFTRNILGRNSVKSVLHCADRTATPFLDRYLSQVHKLAEIFPSCKTLDIKIAGGASHQSRMGQSKFEFEVTNFAQSFTQSHPLLVRAIRTRQESQVIGARTVEMRFTETDDKRHEIKCLHFVTRDYSLKHGETFLDFETELAEY